MNNNIDWKRKLTSRKFWAAIAEFVTLMVVAFHGTQETATQVAAIIMAGAAVVAYIVGEGMVDASNAKTDTIFVEEEKPPEFDPEEDDMR